MCRPVVLGMRGGSWNNNAGNLRVSDRNNAGWTNTNRNNNVGFRPASTPDFVGLYYLMCSRPLWRAAAAGD